MILAQDSKGTAVEAIQAALNLGGTKLRVDGDFGAKTKVAVLQMQRVTKAKVTGTVTVRDEPELVARSVVVPVGSLEPVDIFMSKFPVQHLTQRNNEKKPSGTCNVTSTAMGLIWLLGIPAVTNGVQLEDALYDEINGPEALAYMKKNFSWAVDQKIPPQQVLGMLEWLLKRHGAFQAKFTTEATKDTILKALDTAPVILSGAFTKSGHIVLAIGKTKAGDLIVNDPWGDWTTGYTNTNGASRVYPNETIWKCLDKGKGKCWAITIGAAIPKVSLSFFYKGLNG